MGKIIEEDVFNFYMPLVLHECKNSYRGLEWEDRVEEGGVALIYAIRTYRICNGPFLEYMLAQLRRIIKQKNSEAWAAKSLDSQISLDAPLIAGKNDFTLAACIKTPLPDDSVLDVKCFMNSLSRIERKILRLRMGDFSVYTISIILGMPLPQVQSIVESLKNKVADYYGNDFCLGRKI